MRNNHSVLFNTKKREEDSKIKRKTSQNLIRPAVPIQREIKYFRATVLITVMVGLERTLDRHVEISTLLL